MKLNLIVLSCITLFLPSSIANHEVRVRNILLDLILQMVRFLKSVSCKSSISMYLRCMDVSYGNLHPNILFTAFRFFRLYCTELHCIAFYSIHNRAAIYEDMKIQFPFYLLLTKISKNKIENSSSWNVSFSDHPSPVPTLAAVMNPRFVNGKISSMIPFIRLRRQVVPWLPAVPAAVMIRPNFPRSCPWNGLIRTSYRLVCMYVGLSERSKFDVPFHLYLAYVDLL